ncbi:hypothetical protein ASG22_09270 [Chryseobacterium sp. Leaf405]|uniref:hypothetical protein n=1 Tax=Chryseobacterium sp. Leaf405 TaxID=1736367 RepID=UPI0006FECB0E|nr:hypothetical protein [Chryseobacterium sp. Leaf405]KQT24195.1 hypothetical protein ASG22_09270 [Chryseobacterium sp. Leaf405]
MKKIILIGILLICQILFSQTIFDIEINKNHKYDVYSNKSLYLVLDKTDSTYIFLSLPPLDGGDVKQDAISEGKYQITKQYLTFISINKRNYNFSMFDNLTSLQFKIKKEKLIPKSDKSQYYPYVEELYKADLKDIEYPLNYTN